MAAIAKRIDPKRLYRTKEAFRFVYEVTGISYLTFYKHVSRGMIPFREIGNIRYYLGSDILAYLRGETKKAR